jgi:UDP-N-acetylmuramate--alanine ligase
VLSTTGTNAHLGTGDVFVAEADESDGSFLLYEPTIGILTNVEADHLDHYGTPEKVREAFIEFCNGIQTRGGTIIACADDPGSHDVGHTARAQGAEVVFYGTGDDADVLLHDLDSGIGSRFVLDLPGRETPLSVELRQPGLHNALNATAAIAVAHSLGADVERAATGLAGYGGTRRRFEERGIAAGVRVIDDYAHHPTELRAVLNAARGVVTDGGRVWAIFQPHLYSRTMEFREEFGRGPGTGRRSRRSRRLPRPRRPGARSHRSAHRRPGPARSRHLRRVLRRGGSLRRRSGCVPATSCSPSAPGM